MSVSKRDRAHGDANSPLRAGTHSERGTWTRAEEIELHRIVASGSGPEWQRDVRTAQQHGQTLPFGSGAFGLRLEKAAEKPELS
jgi:hypothetical protein